MMAHIKVPNTSSISMAAKALLFRPNWKYVKDRLKIMLRIKGKRTIKGSFFCINNKTTLPKEIIIRTYKNDHTGPNSQEGGDQDGLINCEYQLLEFIYLLLVYYNSIS